MIASEEELTIVRLIIIPSVLRGVKMEKTSTAKPAATLKALYAMAFPVIEAVCSAAR
jgi:hypothetical protein